MTQQRASKNIAIIGISLILALAGDQTLYVVLPVLAASSLYPLARVGVLLSANRFIRLMVNPIVGNRLRGRARKPFLLAGLLIGAFTPLLYILGLRFFGFFLAGRAFWGIAWSLMNIASVTLALDMTDRDNHGWGSALLQLFYFAGLAITPFLGGLLNDWLGIELALVLSSILGFAAFGLSWIFVEEPPKTETEAGIIPSGTEISISSVLDQVKYSFRVFKPESFSLLYIYMMSAFISEGAIMATLSLYIATLYGQEYAIAGITLQAATIGGAALAYRSTISAILSPWFGRLFDRLKHGWIGLWIANLFGIAGLAGLAWIRHPAVIPVSLLLIAVNSGIIFVGTPVMITRMDKAHQTILVGWMATAVDIGLSLAPLVSYALLERFPVQQLYIMAACLALTTIPVTGRYVFLKQRKTELT